MSITSVSNIAGKLGLPIVASDEERFKAVKGAIPGKPGLPLVASDEERFKAIKGATPGKPGLPIVASDEERFKAMKVESAKSAAQAKDTKPDSTKAPKEKVKYDIDWTSIIFASAIV